ncbi:hypothetical protein JTB14_006205 [Gonioctena quinquepunctata]|nr:hypothetical protein JTB14_006205 [Gonioctena quinquepunctata]
MPRDSDKDSSELMLSLIHEFPSTDYSFADEQKNSEENQFNGEFNIKDENQDDYECSGVFLTNHTGLKMETLKTEDDIDIIYEDVKPEICGGKSTEHKSYSNSSDDILMETKIRACSPLELSPESGTTLQQNTSVEEDEELLKRTQTREEASNCQSEASMSPISDRT